MPATSIAVPGIPTTQLPAVETPLSGDEYVMVVQEGQSRKATAADIAGAVSIDVEITGSDGVTVVESSPNVFAVSLTDVAELTLMGRADGAGTGPPTALDSTQAIEVVFDGLSTQIRLDYDVGYLTVPPTGASDRDFDDGDAGTGVLVTTASAVTMAIPVGLQIGMAVTLAVTDAGGSLTIAPDGGVTLLNMADGSTGDQIISGVGIATIWQISSDFWVIHGTNVEPIA